MAELFGKKYTNRTRFTRMCIGEAVFSLMDKKSYEEIRVSDIVKRAGVSRMTFYHYYEQKEDALADYFHEIVNGYVWERSEILKKGGKFHDPGSIEHALKYFDQYAAFILKLVDAHLYHIILEAMKMETEIVAPADGTVAQILVKAGDAVDTGAALVTLN